jgi:hypothetical protein
MTKRHGGSEISELMPSMDMAEIAARASADAGGVSAQWLGEYLPLLAQVSETGWRPDRAALSRMRDSG